MLVAPFPGVGSETVELDAFDRCRGGLDWNEHRAPGADTDTLKRNRRSARRTSCLQPDRRKCEREAVFHFESGTANGSFGWLDGHKRGGEGLVEGLGHCLAVQDGERRAFHEGGLA